MQEALLIAVAFIFGLSFRHIGLPPLVGYLVAGFLLYGFGYAAGYAIEHMAHVGVLLLLFAVGLKLKFKNILQLEVWGTALVHMAITCALLGAAIHYLTGLAWESALLLGSTLGFSSTVVAAKILEQKRELRAFHGRVAIGILVIQDLVAVALLSVVSSTTPSPWAVILLGLPLIRPLLYWLLEFSGHDELLILFGLLLALAVGGSGFEQVGLSSELGALILGALLANHRRASELSHALWSLKEVFLVAFFLQIGMSGAPTLQTLTWALALAVLLPLKAALFFLILVRFRLRARSAFLTALSLASYSEFALIVGVLAAAKGWLTEDWLVLLALTVAVSFMLAAPVNRLAHGLYQRLDSRLSRFELDKRHPDEQPLNLGDARVLIMGMGRVGTGAYDFLAQRNARVVGLDSDPVRVTRHQGEKRNVHYADSEDPFFWQNLHLGRLESIMLAMPDPEAKEIAIKQLRRRGYRGLISATILHDEEAKDILEAGGNVTFNHYGEAGIGFGERVWEAMYPELTPAMDVRAP